jgi:sodium/bile acid cotransporter 7
VSGGTSRRVTPAAPSSRRGASCVVAAGKGSDVAADAESTPSPIASVAAFAKANYFLLGMFACVFVAAACPSLGANGGPLKPEVTINKLAVRLMFLISGLSLPLDDLRSAVTNVKANALIQFFVFGFAGLATAFGIAPALTKLGVLNHELINGLIVLACLPTTIGTGVALTNASGGNVAVAIFHAVFSNLAGVVVAPALIFFYLGSDAAAATAADLASGGPAASVSKLAYAVLLPVLVGMMIRASPTFGASVATKPVKARLKLASDAIILSIVYNTFCNTFQSGFGVSGKEVTALALVLCVLLAGYKACVFVAARAAGLAKKDVVAATFMGSQKTLAFGLPLIKALFGESPDLVWFCLPVLVYHPLQTLVGSALVPKLRAFAEQGEER